VYLLVLVNQKKTLIGVATITNIVVATPMRVFFW